MAVHRPSDSSVFVLMDSLTESDRQTFLRLVDEGSREDIDRGEYFIIEQWPITAGWIYQHETSVDDNSNGD